MFILYAIKRVIKQMFVREEQPVMPENLVASKPQSKTARNIRLSIDLGMMRERIRTQQYDDRLSALSKQKDTKKKPNKKGKSRMSWSQFVENSRKVADSFTLAFQIRNRKQADLDTDSNKQNK